MYPKSVVFIPVSLIYNEHMVVTGEFVSPFKITQIIHNNKNGQILLDIPHQHNGAAGRATLLWRDHVTLQPGCTSRINKVQLLGPFPGE